MEEILQNTHLTYRRAGYLGEVHFVSFLSDKEDQPLV